MIIQKNLCFEVKIHWIIGERWSKPKIKRTSQNLQGFYLERAV